MKYFFATLKHWNFPHSVEVKTVLTPQDLWRCFCGIWLQEVNTRSLKWRGGVLLFQQIPQMLGQNQIREIWGLSQHLGLFMFLKTLLNNFLQTHNQRVLLTRNCWRKFGFSWTLVVGCPPPHPGNTQNLLLWKSQILIPHPALSADSLWARL